MQDTFLCIFYGCNLWLKIFYNEGLEYFEKFVTSPEVVYGILVPLLIKFHHKGTTTQCMHCIGPLYSLHQKKVHTQNKMLAKVFFGGDFLCISLGLRDRSLIMAWGGSAIWPWE